VLYLMHGQELALPKLKEFDLQRVFWIDTITSNQKILWPNGNVKLDYSNMNNGLKLRKEYYEGGQLKLSVVVFQSYAIDTNTLVDPYTGEFSISIDSGFADIPNGQYYEYIDRGSSESEIMTTGQYLNGLIVGQWSTVDFINDIMTTAKFNNDGYLDGEYVEKYLPLADAPDCSQQFKWRGHYKPICINYTSSNSDDKKQLLYSVRIGTWRYCSKDGLFKYKIKYKYNSREHKKKILHCKSPKN